MKRLSIHLVGVLGFLGLVSSPGLAQGLPPLSPAVTQRIEAEYLTLEERRDLRVYHGVWMPDDLDTPARRARAALMVGAIGHDSLGDDALLLDRAEGMVERGELEEAAQLLAGDGSVRGLRLRADAFAGLGRLGEADEVLGSLVTRMAGEVLGAEELVDGVRGLLLRMQIRGSLRAGGTEYRQVLSLLNKARDELDRLAWPVRLAEAELLYSRHNRAQALQAAGEALSLNPRCAGALAIIGQLQIDGFNFEAAEQIAQTLEELASEFDSISPQAMEIRARALLRQREAHEADEPIEQLLGSFPQHRRGLALSAAAAAGVYDFERTSELLRLFDLLSPGHPLALYEVGRVQAETRQYGAAAASLTEAIRRMPKWSAPHIELGLLAMQSGDDGQALEALKHAMELDPFNARAANSLKLIEQLASYGRVESEHFIVRYRPGVDEILAREMLPVLERIHARVCGDGPGGMNHKPEGRTVIELMPNHEWFSVRITGMPSIHTMAASTGPVIAMEAPKGGVGSMAGPYDWPRVLQHEYAHTVSLSRTKNRIAHWLTEAAAVYVEDAPRGASTWKLLASAYDGGMLFDMREINFAFVRPRKPTDRAQAYAQGHWMYEFIIEGWGPKAPLTLMDEAATGVPEEEAFRRVLGLDYEQFLARFEEWAGEQLTSVGLRQPVGTPSLDDMLEELMTEWSQREMPPSAAERLEALRSLAREHSDHPDVLESLILAEVEQAGGNPTEALVPHLERYARVRPIDDLPHRLLARWYLGRSEPEQYFRAIEHLEFLDVRTTDSAVFAAELARLYFEADELDRAFAKAERSTQIAPFDPNQRELAARIALLRKDYVTAERHIEAMTRIEPDRERNKRLLEQVRTLRAASGSGD